MRKALSLIAVALLTNSSYSATVFTAHNKDSAEPDIQAVFEDQDNTGSRSTGGFGLRLLRRTLVASEGIAPDLMKRNVTDASPALVIAGLQDFPSENDWQHWATTGVDYVEYLGNRHWLLAIKMDIETAFDMTQARSFSTLSLTDKVAPILDSYSDYPGFYNAEDNLIVLGIVLTDSSQDAGDELRNLYHIEVDEFINDSAEGFVSLVTQPENISKIAAGHAVLSVMPGQWRLKPLMAQTRVIVEADEIVGFDGNYLTGKGIKMANREGIGGGVHHDFHSLNPDGTPGGRRWTVLADTFCLNGSDHGQMTGGIMLGNGVESENFGGGPLEFHGIAPEATFECFFNSQARANLSNHSVVQGSIHNYNNLYDRGVLGLAGDNRFHAQIAAAGNNGLRSQYYAPEKGYFSVLNGYKNQMIVGLAQLTGDIKPGSSVGPTYDGRIKPDITAAASTAPYPDGKFSLGIQRIDLIRDNQPIYKWVFPSFDITSLDWHLGWGHTDNPNFGQVFLNIEQSADLNWNVRINVQQPPWGTAYHRAPFVGTQIIPNGPNAGEPLNFLGHEDDVLRVTYRAYDENTGYFNLRLEWFRSFSPVMEEYDWYSQGHVNVFALGDSEWRSIDIPVGQGMKIINPNPHWPQEYTWKDQPIQFLGLRFASTQIQLTPLNPQQYQGASGTSAASPVVAGGYALALEQLSQLYPETDLDLQYTPSAYSVLTNPIPTFPPYGPPLNSTMKGIFVHTAVDMVNSNNPFTQSNPDTGVPTSFYTGPDYASGYGMLNIRKAVDLMTQTAASIDDHAAYQIVENELKQGTYHKYFVDVDNQFITEHGGLKATLVWDDAPGANTSDVVELKLVNNLGMFIKDPQNNIHYPWSLDLPYDIYEPGNGPNEVEPEPITDADIVPARRDQPNDRDNIEQVVADSISLNNAGLWIIYVVDNGIASGPAVQSYSLVISPQNPE